MQPEFTITWREGDLPPLPPPPPSSLRNPTSRACFVIAAASERGSFLKLVSSYSLRSSDTNNTSIRFLANKPNIPESISPAPCSRFASSAKSPRERSSEQDSWERRENCAAAQRMDIPPLPPPPTSASSRSITWVQLRVTSCPGE